MSQSVIQFNKPNPLQDMQLLARSIALPHEYPAQRFPSFPALERTAVMAFNTPFTASTDSVLGAGGVVQGMLARQAAYPLWMTRKIDKSVVYSVNYLLTATDDSVTYPNTVAARTGATTVDPIPVVRLEGAYNGATATGAARNRPVTTLIGGYTFDNTGLSNIPIAFDSGTGPAPWLYVPAYSKIVFTFTGGTQMTTNPNVSVEYEVWLGPGMTNRSDVLMTSGGDTPTYDTSTYGLQAVVTSPGNTWVRVLGINIIADYVLSLGAISMIVMPASTPHTFTKGVGTTAYTTKVEITGAPSVEVGWLLPVANPPEYSNTTLPWSSTRTTAVAVLLTNVTKALNKEGTITAGRVNPKTSFEQFGVTPFNVAVDNLRSLHPAEKALLALENGFYTFAPPSTDLAEFWDYNALMRNGIRTVSGISYQAPAYRLDNDSLVNCFFLTDSDTTTLSQFAGNLDWHIEFRSSSTLWPIGLSLMTIEAFHQAQFSLVEAGFFFNNRDHKKNEMTITQKIGMWAGRIAPMVRMMHPAAGAAANALSAVISAKPGPPPKPNEVVAAPSTPVPKKKNKKAKGKPSSKEGKAA